MAAQMLVELAIKAVEAIAQGVDAGGLCIDAASEIGPLGIDTRSQVGPLAIYTRS